MQKSIAPSGVEFPITNVYFNLMVSNSGKDAQISAKILVKSLHDIITTLSLKIMEKKNITNGTLFYDIAKSFPKFTFFLKIERLY